MRRVCTWVPGSGGGLPSVPRETNYNAFAPSDPGILEQDPRNFKIFRSEVVRTRFSGDPGMWTPGCVGAIELDLFAGAKRRFILTGGQDPEAVRRLVQHFDQSLEVTTKTTAEKRTEFLFLSLLALLTAAGLGSLGWLGGPGPHALELFLMAAVALAIAGLGFVRTWRTPKHKGK